MHRTMNRRTGSLFVLFALAMAACTDDDDAPDGRDNLATDGNTGGGTGALGGSPSGDGSGGGGESSAGAAAGTGGQVESSGGSNTDGSGSASSAITGGSAATTGGSPNGAGTTGLGGSEWTTGGAGGTATASGGGGMGTAGGGVEASGGSDSTTGGSGGSAGATDGGAGSGTAGHTEGGSAAAGGDSPQGLGGAGGQPPADVEPSSGCDAASPPASGRYTIDVAGTAREYILKLPEGHDASRPYPLILAWHGGQYDADWVDSGGEPQSGPYYGVEGAANGNAIFVAPQALSSSWTNQDGRDIAFVDAMLAALESQLCVDLARLFATGFSMGGIMTLTIGCERGDIFRAIAPMSGSLEDGCPDGDHSIAYWSSHGSSDTTITLAEGEASREEFIRLNHCGQTSATVEPSECVSYDGCDPGYPVVFCTFDGAHEPAPFAGEEIWGFFSQF